MKSFLDGTASFLAALATIAICGGPAWFTYKAIEANVAPWWAWFFIVALAGVGVIMTVAFLRKTIGGIAPSRERKRR
ncbi:hypothetical protein Q4555_11740 [Octadecabacter sp. 1_MG-2023]|uniref:hypothetical protein n=1 Tax=unclassified Octadecabacter TaxID=196158 RepID=UPI001C0A2352|nr:MULTISPECIES: hypothetical protein [unclassified Octadecabacter]MBU2993814.1 hypothetical protein [Octadecabacter sp. B2R22]MDO6735341.1 hypothetical protein [Octadecabacter sp. 1_MG-2023]